MNSLCISVQGYFPGTWCFYNILTSNSHLKLLEAKIGYFWPKQSETDCDEVKKKMLMIPYR